VQVAAANVCRYQLEDDGMLDLSAFWIGKLGVFLVLHLHLVRFHERDCTSAGHVSNILRWRLGRFPQGRPQPTKYCRSYQCSLTVFNSEECARIWAVQKFIPPDDFQSTFDCFVNDPQH
jgi:hypothetical protein